MPVHVVFLLHGMGNNSLTALSTDPDKQWVSPVIARLHEAWSELPNLRKHNIDDHVRFVPITYDQIFYDYLKSLATDAERKRKILGESPADELLKQLGKADGSGFVWSNVADVLLYRFGHGVARQTHATVLKAITNEIQTVWDDQGSYGTHFSVIAHSLGTAVANGALNALGGNPIGGSEAYTARAGFKFHTYMTLANVSRVLWYGEQEIYRGTLVRPDFPPNRIGYLGRFINARHVADPFPAPRRFRPTDWGPLYRDIVLRHVHEPNVHSFLHYLRHPRVTGAFFQSLFGEITVPDTHVEDLARDFDPYPRGDKGKLKALVEGIEKEYANRFDESQGVFLPTAGALFGLMDDLFRSMRTLQELLES